jgi:hypothetical protein
MPKAAPRSGKRDALGEQLTHQPAARRAQCEPHGDLFLPRRRARQQQAGDVGTANQQHDAHRDHQRVKQRGEPPANAGKSGLRRHQFNGGRVRGVANGFSACIRLLRNRAVSWLCAAPTEMPGFKRPAATIQNEPASSCLGDQAKRCCRFSALAQRHREIAHVARRQISERFFGDAHNGERQPVQIQRLSDNRPVARKLRFQ